jgi:hypothetical protein
MAECHAELVSASIAHQSSTITISHFVNVFSTGFLQYFTFRKMLSKIRRVKSRFDLQLLSGFRCLRFYDLALLKELLYRPDFSFHDNMIAITNYFKTQLIEGF